MPIKIRVANIVSGLVIVIRRFPLPVLASWIVFGSCLALLESPEPNVAVELLRVIFVGTLAVPLCFGLALLREQSSQQGIARYAFETVAVGLLVAYGIWWQIQPEDVPFKHYVSYALLLLVVHFFVACAPFLKRNHTDGFWNYNKSLFLRYLLGVLYSVVLFAGLALALLSVDRLLSLKIDGESYGRLFYAIVTIFHPLFFFSGIPKNFTQASREFPVGLRRFVQFCLVPLVVIYLAILYLYTAKIIFMWELPNGWVALPVLILSVLGILSALLLDPLRKSEEFPWAESFTRWFYRLLLPLTILLMISIGVRIADYGVTENRYFVAILAGWLFIVAASYGVLNARSTRWIPLSLGVICLLSAWGPWSASSVSFCSQKALVMADLSKLGVLSNDKLIAKPQTISSEEYTGIRSRLQYLFHQHDAHLLDTMMANFANWSAGTTNGIYYSSTAYNRAKDVLRVLKISPDTQQSSFYRLKTIEPFAIRADGIISYHRSQYYGQTFTGDLLPNSTLTLTFEQKSKSILMIDTEKVTVSWTDLINALPYIDQTDIPHKKLTQSVVIGPYRVELTATEIYINRINGKPVIQSINLLVIVYLRDD